MSLDGLRIALVGPMPPPEGGIANQTRQLGELLAREGARVIIVPVNHRYQPAWIGRVRGVRALFRLLPYMLRLWRAYRQAEVAHVMASSGWSWHLFAAPAIWLARIRGVPVVVNYRGGEADAFLTRAGAFVFGTLRGASVLAVPSGFLQQVFLRWGIPSVEVPNIIDLDRFRPATRESGVEGARLVVARSLEPIYDIPTALRAFAIIRAQCPEATLCIAGTGPECAALRSLAVDLGVADAVEFCGRLDRDQMAGLYRAADVVINPSRVDNMPNSVLEAMASGVPVVSTRVGGVPYILKDGLTGLLIDPGDHEAMAAAVGQVLDDDRLAARLRCAALDDVQQYAWPRVRQRWADVYASVLDTTRANLETV